MFINASINTCGKTTKAGCGTRRIAIAGLTTPVSTSFSGNEFDLDIATGSVTFSEFHK